jgi:succinate dehydrogenase / fumarate reductase cytochrome b subunit
MGWVIKFAQSSLGAKVLMALSGVLLFGFVLVHMLGNLQIFLGQEPYNAYAHFLKSTPELLWAARLTLLGAVGLHVWAGVRLSLLNRAARPRAYVEKDYTRASFTSRTMLWTGLTVLAFIVYHLAHFTLGLTDPTHYDLIDPKGYHDAYSMFVYGFQNVYVSMFYIIAMVFLGLHLEHGVSSMFQTLGINHPRINGLTGKIGPIFAVLVVLGNISMPIAVMMGIITLPAGVA